MCVCASDIFYFILIYIKILIFPLSLFIINLIPQKLISRILNNSGE